MASRTPAFANPVRGGHALMLGRGAVPALEEAPVGTSVGDTVSVEVSRRLDDEEANDKRTPSVVPRLRVPPRTVREMLPEWLANIARQEDVHTPHEFVDLPAEDIADEYMLNTEGIEELQSDLVDEIYDWHLAECEVIDAVR